MFFTLDTNVLIDISNSDPVVREQYDREVASGAKIVACPVAISELVFGAMVSGRPDYHVARAHELIADLYIVELTADDCLRAAEIRRNLRRKGWSIGAYDLLIAGQALNRGFVMVSSDLKDMGRVEGLAHVDWRDDGE
jgi:tRNA(fMet)-specific endonuclease VapC